MSDAPLLAGRRGLVLGVSSERSMGFHIACALRAHGAEVAVTYRPARSNACGPRCEEAGLQPALPVDFLDDATVNDAFAQLGRRWHCLDFLIHTLVHVPDGVLSRPLTAVTASEFGATLDASVWSLVRACRAALPLLELSDGARVVTLTSIGSTRAVPGYHLAGIAKAALEAAVRYLALELGPRRILVNAASFSLIETATAVKTIGAERSAAARAFAARRALTRSAVTEAEVASTVAFLASPLCQNLTGEILSVDGGLSTSWG